MGHLLDVGFGFGARDGSAGSGRRPGWRRVGVAAGMCAALALAGITPLAAQASVGKWKPLSPAKEPVGKWAPLKAGSARAAAQAGAGGSLPARVPWPQAGSGTVAVAGAQTAVVSGTPVRLVDASTGHQAAARRVRVQVRPRAEAQGLHVSGLVFTVATTSGASAPTRVSVDVRGVAQAYGGDWGARARLVQLTGCHQDATGVVSGCTGRVDLPTTNTQGTTVSATLTPATDPTPVTTPATTTTGASGTGSTAVSTLTTNWARTTTGGSGTTGPTVSTSTTTSGAGTTTGTAGVRSTSASAVSSRVDAVGSVIPAAVAGTSSLVSAAAAGTGTVVALTAAVSGSAGSYAATSLTQASSWAAGNQSGSFTWNYPINVPAVPGGLVPGVGIGYDSGSVDGRVASTNNQPSWIGDGFDLGAGYIERSYVACNDDKTTGSNNETLSTGDLCWKSDNATISMGSRSGPLVLKSVTDGTWKLYADDGSKITHVGKPQDGTGEYWTLTTSNGTVYTFGKGSAVGSTATGSAWTVPVASNQPNEPNYNTSYAASIKTMVWRWNLDSVVDVHGNAMTYVYTPETNNYGENANHTVVTYTRGGVLKEIDYGLRTNATSAPAGAKVVFTPAERCIPTGSSTCPSQLISTTASSWPDVPFDQICDATPGTVSAPATGGCVNVQSPAFFSQLRLTGITTQILKTGTTTYNPVDTYGLTQKFRASGDTTNSQILLLTGITHTGKGGGGSLAAPSVTLKEDDGAPNRVDAIGDGAPALIHYRLGSITTGSGETISVSYSTGGNASKTQDCTSTQLPTDVTNNTMRCFQAGYVKPGASAATLNWFHKYLVTQVDVRDDATHQPDVVTTYQYEGNPAWHFDRDDTVPAKLRAWGQWRGFPKVLTVVGGVTGPWTASESWVMQGMNGDCADTACTTKKAVSFTDSRGGTQADDDLDAGVVRDGLTFNGWTGTLATTGEAGGTTGAKVSETLNTPWLSAATATDALRSAKLSGISATNTRNYRADGTTYLETATSTTFNADGLPSTVENLGDDRASMSGDDSCARYTRTSQTATNPPVYIPGTTLPVWIIGVVTATETDKGTCAATPSRPGDILAATRTVYDGASSWAADQSATLTKGDVAQMLDLSGWDTSSGTGTYQLTGKDAYDAFGRVVDVWDAANHNVHTAYTQGTTGPVSQVKVTDALSHTATTTLDAWRGLPLTVTDINSNVTTLGYDPLGRLTGVWKPGQSTSGSANTIYSYTLSATAPAVVTTKSLMAEGTYITSYAYYDGMLRPWESQSSPGTLDTANRIVSVNSYDGRGLLVSTAGPSQVSGAPSATDPGTIVDYSLTARTDATYDGAGRITKSSLRSGTHDAGWTYYTTTTSYDGENTTVVPPTGGTPSTVITDALGRTATLRQYTTSSGVSGAYQDTTYTYRPDGLLTSITDPAGAVWTRGYDLMGRQTSSTDPDAGATSTTYTSTGQIQTATDASGTLAYEYDVLDRATKAHTGSLTGPVVAAWTYDTATKGLGQLATATSYSGSNAYTRAVTGYDAWGHVTGTTLTIPNAEGTALQGTYTHTYTYRTDGLLYSDLLPNLPGKTGEKYFYYYDALGQVKKFGTNSYFQGLSLTYTAFGELNQLDASMDTQKDVVTSYAYDTGTRRLTSRAIQRFGYTGYASNENYTYDPAGNLTQISEQPTDTAAGTPADTQCFSYNALQQLTRAWTPNSASTCASTPSTSILGGPAPYWQDWTYNLTSGLRATQVDHTSTGTSTTAYTYPTTGAVHTLTGTTTTGTTTASTAYTYDSAGNLKTTTPGTGTATALTWDAQDHLTQATKGTATTSYIYDATGTRLLTHDATGTTLYVDATNEIHIDTATGNRTSTRYYTLAGQTRGIYTITTTPTGTITSATSTLTATDPHGTIDVAVASAPQTVTNRRTQPFGTPRGTQPTWGTTRGFVNGITDTTTGYTRLGARDYDPATGRFITTDPVFDLGDPKSFNGYDYADNNPTTADDATGLNCHSAASCKSMAGEMKQEEGHSAVYSEENPGVEAAREDAYEKRAEKAEDDYLTNVRNCLLVNNDCVSTGGGDPQTTYYAIRDQIADAYNHGQPITRPEADFWKTDSSIQGSTNEDLDVEGILTMLIPAGTLVKVTGMGVRLLAGRLIVRAADDVVIDTTVGGASRLIEGAGSSLAASGTRSWMLRAGESCLTGNSFTAYTLVLMADGTKKPIKDVKVGDRVLATDTATGKTTARTVQAVMVNRDSNLYDITIKTPHGLQEVHTTTNHPIWSDTSHAWIPAAEVDKDSRLRTLNGEVATLVVGHALAASRSNMWDLTVAQDHDFYVLVGPTPILVHNSGICVTSLIEKSGSPLLVRAAKEAGRNEGVQREMDGLIAKLGQGNMNPGIANKFMTGLGINYARGRLGARVFFRNTQGGIEILAKASKDNETRVWNELRRIYG